ncbi:uncharacterized protein CXorf65 homolog [Haliotis rufescens]|uniref:uncharacterized protein CXorf65 homolog n=1 Tax=Haliotis rufescens TaxID=6454 RepID=UPI00201E8AEC|nr:uncharacterized protein CXorf65 homolog [Haliotis rufescens]
MFIRLIYGEQQMILVNPNCTAKLFIDYIKATCSFDDTAIIDLCDESGNLAYIHTKHTTDNVFSLTVPRATYMPVLIEKGADDSMKSIVPLLVDWDKTYPTLDRRLKQYTAAAEKPKKVVIETKGKRRERLGDQSPSRRSSSSGNSNEMSPRPSNMGKISRKK